MAGVTDLPFRVLCRRQGASMVCCEMVSAKALYYGNKKTHELLRISPEEHPVSLQIFGSEPEIMGEAAKILNDCPLDILDINMGCPVPKVVKNGEGSALMKDPVLAGRIIEAVVKASDRPVTVKIRKGFDEEHVNAPEIARIAELSGASAVTVHGRTREQYYSGEADWDVIAGAASLLSIPVIGNGDVTDGESAVRMIRDTGVSAVMVGRAARGNPWIFGEIGSRLEGKESPPGPDLGEIKEMVIRHAEMQTEMYGEARALRMMRSHVMWYSALLSHGKDIRRRAGSLETMEELRELAGSFEI